MSDYVVRVSMLIDASTPERAAAHFARFLRDNSEVLVYEVLSTTGQIQPDLVDLTNLPAEKPERYVMPGFGMTTEQMQDSLDLALGI